MIAAVVPAFNEGKNIGRVVRGLFEQDLDLVIVVDDGSEDDTAAMAEEAGATVVIHPINLGQGAALRTGNDLALALGADLIVHFDADGQLHPEDIQGAVEILQKENLDIVLGSRFLDNRSNIPYIKRHLVLPLGRVINFLYSGLFLTDAHNGFRILNRNAAEKITISQSGMAHNSEIPAEIKRLNLRYAEVPVRVTYSEYGQGIGGGIKIVWDLVLSVFV